MAKLINYGIIGCGMMGQEHLRNIALLPDTNVAAIFEPDVGMAGIAKTLAPNAQFCDSIDALLAIEALDCLVIISPNFMHLEQLEQIAQTRSLPILVEKPLFTDPNAFARVRKFSETYPSPVWVAMEYRYMPPIAALRAEVEEATGGIKMLSIREHRFPFLEKVGDWNRFNAKSGGTFVEKCCHFFDLMRLLTKSEPVRIMASAGQNVNHLDEVYDGQTSDIIDNGYVIVFSGEVVRECAPIPQLIVSPRNPSGPEVREIPVDPTLLDAGDHNGSTFYQHEGFLALVRGERDVADVTFEDGLRAVAMGMAAQESARTGQSVLWAEFMDK